MLLRTPDTNTLRAPAAVHTHDPPTPERRATLALASARAHTPTHGCGANCVGGARACACTRAHTRGRTRMRAHTHVCVRARAHTHTPCACPSTARRRLQHLCAPCGQACARRPCNVASTCGNRLAACVCARTHTRAHTHTTPIPEHAPRLAAHKGARRVCGGTPRGAGPRRRWRTHDRTPTPAHRRLVLTTRFGFSWRLLRRPPLRPSVRLTMFGL